MLIFHNIDACKTNDIYICIGKTINERLKEGQDHVKSLCP